jgi:hypothetical protein
MKIEQSNAQRCHGEIIYLRNAIKGAFLELGQKLYEMWSEGYYLALGYNSFREYADSPEIDITYRNAQRLVGVYEEFVLHREYDTVSLIEIGYSKLDRIKPYVDDKNIDELMASAKTLTRDDLVLYVKERFGQKIKPNINWEQIADMLYNGDMGARAEYAEAKQRMIEWRTR